MLFNSSTFLLLFLPVVLAGYFVWTGVGRRHAAEAWLTVASLFFYGWWNPRYLLLLLASVVLNYLAGLWLAQRRSRLLLIGAIAFNLVLLGYFKYTNFVVQALDDVFSVGWTVSYIVLPLAISFYTFQQIAYLWDVYDGVDVEKGVGRYFLFITFFPQLIAGPIVHHREMISQFDDPQRARLRWQFLAIGATIFFIGLAKKVEIADRLSTLAGPVFAAAAASRPVGFVDAWAGALAYSLQLYFDFSGYTDMAIGLGMMFGIRLPQNFNSPYKARSVIDFWARWHMTLTRFLTAYVYNPIVVAVTRARVSRRLPLPRRGRMSAGVWLSLVAYPTLLTMFVSGVWHGAGWQFVVFGLLHGFYLCVNHGWRALKAKKGLTESRPRALTIAASVATTFVCVVVALVFFRAESVGAAMNLLSGMVGAAEPPLPPATDEVTVRRWLEARLGIVISPLTFTTRMELLAIAVMLAVVWMLPNTQQWLHEYPTALQPQPHPSWLQRRWTVLRWRPSMAWAVLTGWLGFFIVMRACSRAPTEFLYFQF